jgi:hypothetical protein
MAEVGGSIPSRAYQPSLPDRSPHALLAERPELSYLSSLIYANLLGGAAGCLTIGGRGPLGWTIKTRLGLFVVSFSAFADL